MNNRKEKSYKGTMMQKGETNELIVYNWLIKNYKGIIDFRSFRLAQRIDVDFGIETIDGDIVLAEIKSDIHIRDKGNLCFEFKRINHFVKDKWFYLGWGWRSPARKLIVRNPATSETYIFDFLALRKRIGEYIAVVGKKLIINITETDKQKTTFNYLIPMIQLKGTFKKCIINPVTTEGLCSNIGN